MLTRKQFMYSLVGLVACTKSDDPEPVDASPQPSGQSDAAGGAQGDAPPAACPAPATTIGANHDHTCTIPPADIDAGIERSYDITGTSNHPHAITVTAAMFEMLRGGGQVTVRSSFDDDHTHDVTIRC